MLRIGKTDEISPLVDELLSDHSFGSTGAQEQQPLIASRLRDTDRNFFEIARFHGITHDPTRCSDYRIINNLAKLRQQATKQQWQPDQLAAATLHAITHIPSMLPEGALGLIGKAQTAQADLFEHYKIAVADGASQLASESAQKNKPAEALHYLTLALMTYLTTDYFDVASIVVWLIHSVLLRRHRDINIIGNTLTQDTVDDLLAISDEVCAYLDETAHEYLRRSWVQILAALTLRNRCGDKCLTNIMQVLKGSAFGAALTTPGPARESAAERTLLMDIARLKVDDSGGALAGSSLWARDWNSAAAEAEAEADAATRELVPLLDQEGMLGAFMSEREFQQGGSKVEILRNMYRQYQRFDTNQLMSRALSSPHALIPKPMRYRSPRDVSQALPGATLLVSVVFGIVAVRNPQSGVKLRKAKGFYATFCDHRGSDAMAVYDPSDPAVFDTTALVEPGSTGRGIIRFSEFGLRMAALRRSLVEDPMHRHVGREASEHLKGMAIYFSPLLERLSKADEHVTHLCIWPQESLYFLPFQILSLQDGIIADRFIVTTIPSLEVLFTPRTHIKRTGFLVVGCAEGGVEYGLQSEPSLHTQVESISEVLDVSPVIGMEATPEKVQDLMQVNRYIHIAAHGAQNVDSPAFHCLFLSSADKSDGRLYAHDITKCDLRGVELVTLSACESALFRFDVNDNLYGLAAAFLRGGARVVVGALWPVKAEVASWFFVVFYSEIAAGHDKLFSYRQAQSATRLKYPEYRDWAAFTFMGDWR